MEFKRGSLDNQQLIHLYRSMVLPRMIEDKMLILLRQGKITKWFSGWGQEGISVGCAYAMNQDEYILPMHRNLGIFTTRGIPLERLFAQFQGKLSGFTKGRDRSFHFGTQEYKVVGMISHLGPQLGIADGIALAAKAYKVDVIGGDTTSSQKGLIISITAIGEADEAELTYRNGAKSTDLLVVTGDIGAAYMGLQVLEREKQVFLVNPNSQPDLDAYTYLIERQLKPEARKDVRTLLHALEIKPTSMIDISDGLSSEIIHLCKQSKVGCNLYEDKLPLDPQFINVCEEFDIDSTTVAINGGEDYELLFTIAMEDFDKIKGNPNFSIIGHMTQESEGIHLVTRANTKIPLKARGWNAIAE